MQSNLFTLQDNVLYLLLDFKGGKEHIDKYSQFSRYRLICRIHTFLYVPNWDKKGGFFLFTLNLFSLFNVFQITRKTKQHKNTRIQTRMSTHLLIVFF